LQQTAIYHRETYKQYLKIMKFRKFYTTAALILTFTAFSYAQDETEAVSVPESQNAIEAATRVSEFGKIGDVEKMKRVDSFLIELQGNPGAAGYIVFYQGKDVAPAQYDIKGEDIYRDHLKFKNADNGQIVFLNAFREHQSTELWIVPAGQPVPQVTNTIAVPAPSAGEAYLYSRTHFEHAADDFLLSNVIDRREAAKEEFLRDNGDSVINEEENGTAAVERSPEEFNFSMFQRSWPAFNEKLKEDTGSRGVVIFYADDKMVDVNKIRGDVESRVKIYAGEAKIGLDRFQIVFGGYRSGIDIEMWVAPKTAKAPQIKPDQRSSVAD
jgi:hypothetical protein